MRGAEHGQGSVDGDADPCLADAAEGIGETRQAPSPLQAAEMVLVRLAFAADLPSPAEALDAAALRDPSRPPPGGGGGVPPPGGGYAVAQAQATVNGASAGAAVAIQAQPQGPGLPQTFEDLVALFAEKREAVLAAVLAGEVHLVHYEAGRVEFRPDAAAPADLATRCRACSANGRGVRGWSACRASPEPPPCASRASTAKSNASRMPPAILLCSPCLPLFPVPPSRQCAIWSTATRPNLPNLTR